LVLPGAGPAGGQRRDLLVDLVVHGAPVVDRGCPQAVSWIFITDPDFAAKAQRVLDLYQRVWDGQPLGPNDFVICCDELCDASHNSSDVKSSVM
jgi:hypothetical protein